MKSKLLSGFAFLLSSSGLTALLGFGVLIIVVQIIGVEEYGKFAGAFSILLFLELVLKFEIKLVLVKYEFKFSPYLYHTAFNLLLLFSGLTVLVLLLLYLLIPSSLNPYQEFSNALILLSFVLPISVLTEIPRAILEREMKFKLIAKQELASALAQHGVCLGFVLMYESLWALIISWYVYSISIFCLSWLSANYRPKLKINRVELSILLFHGKHMFYQNLLSQSKKLVNPLIVGFFIGAEGVGLVSFAEKSVYGLTFIKNAIQRVSVSMLGKLEGDKEQVVKSANHAILLYALPLGFVLLLGSFIVFIISINSGQDLWTWVHSLYPYLAVSFYFFVMFTIPTATLQMYDGLNQVSVFWFLYILLFSISAYFGVKYYGLIGYGLAEIIALPAYVVLFKRIKMQWGNMMSSNIIILIICIPIALMWNIIDWFALFAAPALFLLPDIFKMYKSEFLLLFRL